MKEQKLDEQMAVTYDNEKAFKDLFALRENERQ